MKRVVYGFLVFSVVIFIAISAGASSVPVSPADDADASGTVQNCPTFSWSASADAAAYRIEVYEQVTTEAVSHERMKLINRPVITKEITAPALSWTPSSAECLSRGVKYVWYVQGMNADGQGTWSEGKIFSIDPSVLSLEQKDAVQEVVKEYLSGDSINSTALTTTGATDGTSGTRAANSITPLAVGPISATGDADKTFLGTNAGISNTIGGSNTFIGAEAGASNTTGWANTFIGYVAGQSNAEGAHNNTFVGQAAGWKNTAGSDNTFVGNGAGQFNTVGNYNTFIGSGAGTATLANPLTNGYNSFMGYQAGQSNTVGGSNGFFGARAGYSNTNGFYNVFVGQQAGYLNTSGSNNVFVGETAGYSNETGERNVFLGAGAGFCETGSDKLIIDNSYYGSCGKPLIYGEFVNRIVKIDGRLEMVTVAAPSDARYKKDIVPLESSLDKVLHLQGVSYLWRRGELKGAGFETGRQIGLIAQEVEKILPELVHTDGKGYKSLSYDKIVPVLIEAIKEQQKKIEDQQMTMMAQRERIEKDERLAKEKDIRMDRLEQSIQNQQDTIADQQNAILLLTARMAALEGPSKSVALK